MDNFRAALEKLNPEQRQVVETIEGPLLVLAGPGTGKTETLTVRVANILAVSDINPENILCLTFTDNAVRVMRERLNHLIGREAYGLTIATYHGFGREIIKSAPEYFAEEADLVPIDEIAADSLLRTLLNELPYTNPFKRSAVYIKDLKSLISDLRRSLITPEELRATVTANLEFAAQLQPLIKQHLTGFERISRKAIDSFEKLAGHLQPPATTPTNQSILPLEQLFTSSLHKALADCRDSGKTKSLTAWKGQWLSKNTAGEFILWGTNLNRRLLAFADIYADYLSRLSQHRSLDFDDMILKAVRGLEVNDELRMNLQERYQYVLLDEFQDTNGAQLRLVELITNNPVSEGRPNVMAVGDDDQAIYAFQGADYSHLNRFKQLYREVKQITLKNNYRSSAEIMQFAAGIGSQIKERLSGSYVPLIAKRHLPATDCEIIRAVGLSEVSELTWVADKIAELIKDGLAPDQIAVLAPRHRYLEPLVAYLHERQIHVAYEKREDVLQDPAIAELLLMSRLVLALAEQDRRQSDYLWPLVLTSPIWKIETLDLWHLSWDIFDNHSRSWTDRLVDNPSTKEIARFFIRLSQLVERLSMETMLDYLIGTQSLVEINFKSPFYAYYQTQNNFWQLLINLTMLRERLREYRPEVGCLYLKDLTDFAADCQAADIKITSTNPHQETKAAVQLMTAFAGKGQEFDAVFLIGLSDEIWGRLASYNQFKISLPANLRFVRPAGDNDDDRLRLLYVAITRARSRLYLTSHTSSFTGNKFTPLSYLNETISLNGDICYSPLLPAERRQVMAIDTTDKPPQPAALAAFWQPLSGLNLRPRSQLKLQLKQRLTDFQLSPTHVTTFINLNYGGPEQFFQSSILRFPQAPSLDGDFGNVMHETLEFIHRYNRDHNQLPDAKILDKWFSRRLLACRRPVEEFDRLAERGRNCLKLYLEQRAHTINTANECEFSFRNQQVVVNGVRLGGKIDKLIINEKNRTLSIVDYKTGASKKRWDESERLHRYRLQLYLYKILCENSRRFQGYRISDAYLEFIEGDDEGVITELHLPLNQAEADRTEQLARAIWQKIMSLNMPDTKGYAHNLKGMETFEADLISELDKK